MSVSARPPIWRLIAEAAGSLPSPMSTPAIVGWITTRYPDVAENTIRAQVAALTGNNQTYLNHPTYSARPPVLWSVAWGQYEPYDLTRHGEPAAVVPGDDQIAEYDEEPRAPVWQLIAQAARELASPFSAQELVDWFADHYPDVPPSTVRTQMSDWAGNSPAYLFNPAYNRRPPVLWRVSRGKYEPYDSRRHGEIIAAGVEAVERSPEDAVEAAQEFILEQYLEEFLAANWTRIDFGRRLELWSPDSRPPRQFDASPAGRLDFLCRDLDTDALVVVELKRGIPADSVVGQTLRYMGWVKSELARSDQRVDGIIIVGEAEPRLLLAASVAPGLRIVQYRIDFRLEPAE